MKFLIIVVLVSLTALLSFQNCARVSAVDLAATEKVGDLGANDTPTEVTEETEIDEVIVATECEKALQEGRLQTATYNFNFEKQTKTCDWGINGNLSKVNAFVRARDEKYQTIDFNPTQKVCDIKLNNTLQNSFIYDDNIIITLNKYILASTTNFSRHFASKNGLTIYNWSSIIGKDAQNNYEDTTPDKQYCLTADGYSSYCLFPATETTNKIELNFDKNLIQKVLVNSSLSTVELGVITTGDNDDTDCKHSGLNFDVTVQYIN